VLKEIGADAIPQILVLNKIDLINISQGTSGYQRNEYGRISQVRLSAKIGEGLEFIRMALAETIEQRTSLWCEMSPEIGDVTNKHPTISY
jgi:GTP-binding protein HflX